ncbi:MAG: ATP-grasp fold amidoligase family protein [Clostridia bacterium]
MTESLQNKKTNWKNARSYVLDVLFALWLFTEVVFEHSLVSRLCMGLFIAGVFIWMLSEKRIYCAQWMFFTLLFIFWSFLGAKVFALNAGASMDLVKTLCVNLVFLFFMYQYLVLRRDMPAVYLAFCVAVAAMIIYVTVRCWPINVMETRFGWEINLNPNWIGMLAAYAFGMCFMRALEKNPWWLAAALFFGLAVLLTKSNKAYGMIAIFFLAIVLMRWPKHWWLKLIIAVVVMWVLFRFVIIRIDFIDHIFFRRLRHIYENIFMGGDNISSLNERMILGAVGMDAFRLRPFSGYGLDGFRFLQGSQGTYSHNNYIELLVAGGIPLLLLFYVPQVIGLVQGVRKRSCRAVRTALLFCSVQIFMDIGMVSYVDRTALLIPLFLYAATRMAGSRPDDGNPAYSYALNPCRLVQWCSTHGKCTRMPDKLYLRLLYRGCTGKRLHLNPPVTMNEKLQWMKLYDHNPLYPTLVDKIAVRDYVTEKVGAQVLVPLLGIWDSVDEIDFSALPKRFVLKCTHDSGGVRVCADKATFDCAEAKAFLCAHLNRRYYTAGREWPYKNLTPRVMAEAFIGDENGNAPDDLKFYCFDGVVRAILLCTNRTKAHADYYFFDRNFLFLPVNDLTKAAVAEGRTIDPPQKLPALIALAEALSSGLSQVRVDLYDTTQGLYFGELTLFDQSGFANDYVDGGDALMGSFFHIPEANP